MALVLANRVQETTTTTGTGTITLAGAVAGFQSFAVVGNGNTTYYTITSGSAWEVGIGTYSTAGPTLARTTILSSSAGGAAITLAGTSAVFVTYPAEDSVYQDGATIAAGTAVLPATNGGTGQSSYAVGDLLFASTTTALSKLADVATGNALISGGVGVAPSYGKIGLTTHITGTLAVGNGGTGAVTLTTRGVLIGNGTNAVSATAAGTTGQVLVGNTGADPSWATLTSTAVTSFSAGTTGLTPSTATQGAITLAGTLAVANGGTGVTTSTGTGSVVLSNSPVLVTPTLGAASATSIANGLGAVGTPSYTFTGDLNTGMWSPAADTIAFSEGGVEAMRIDSSGNVGIGTTSPGAKLDVSSSTFNIVASRSTGGYAAFQRIAPAGQWTYDFYTINGVEAARITVTDTNIMAFATGSAAAERMRITSAGNVGIGTSAPVGRLQLAGTGSGSTSPEISFENQTATTGRTYSIISGDGGPLRFQDVTAGAERMRIASDGNVGIGLTNPGYPLAVQASSGSGAIRLVGRSADSVSTLEFINNTQATTQGFIQSNGNNLLFATSTSERMRIDTSGNVGIGTSSPDANAKLDVAGTVRSGAGGSDPGTGAVFYLVGSGSFQTVIGGAAFAVNTGANNARTERMRIASDGTATLNVGGVSSTHSFLYNESGGEIQLVDSTGAGPILLDNSGGLARFYKVGTGAMSIGTTGANYIQYITNSAERMRIDSSGNVGIGTSAPSYLLQGVQNGNAEFRVSSTNAGTNSAGLTVENQGNRNWNLWANRATDKFIIGANNRANDFLSVDGSTGNVGIGTSAPASLLHVKRGSNAIEVYPTGTWASRVINATDAAGENGLLVGNRWAASTSTVFEAGSIFGGGAGSWYSYYKIDGIGQSFWSNGGTERMRLDTSGRLGIGTSAPGKTLDLVGQFRVSGSAASGYALLEYGTSATATNNWHVGSEGDGTFRWYNGNFGAGTERMRITSAGNVGIGTSAPGYKLDVNGTGYFNSSVQFFSQDGFRFTSASAVSAMRFGSATAGESTAEWAYNRAAGATTLSVGNTGSALNERMRIDASGNVGIGTSSPGAKLDVTGNIRLSAAGPNIEFNNGGGMVYGPAANTLAFATGGGPASPVERMRINSAGKVGIGTSSPDATAILDVSSTTAGFLPPRMSTAERDAIGGGAPQEGLILYNVTTDKLQVYSAGAWVNLH